MATLTVRAASGQRRRLAAVIDVIMTAVSAFTVAIRKPTATSGWP